MFYSQFILAKKGPLGTIWIAAHLERKLRKNQVADTDIGVSVDSILSPDIPIALRVSSHLLLGVVRIYSRKVNYLFHDCSETLLKVKQAFRSTVVDLPPEESTAPYHSITLPETFDLDDFVLPDAALRNGNFVDHHVSAREQITLQDSLEGAGRSTLQFGLDERFGDGDAPQIGLDIDEDLFLEKDLANHDLPDTLGLREKMEVQMSDLPETPFPCMDLDDCQDDFNEHKIAGLPNDLSVRVTDIPGKPYVPSYPHVGSDFPNMHGYNIQTPDLNELIFGDAGIPHGMDASYTEYSDALHSGPVEHAEAPSTPVLVEEAIPANVQEAPLSPHGKISPSDVAEDIIPDSVHTETECHDSTSYNVTIHSSTSCPHGKISPSDVAEDIIPDSVHTETECHDSTSHNVTIHSSTSCPEEFPKKSGLNSDSVLMFCTSHVNQSDTTLVEGPTFGENGTQTFSKEDLAHGTTRIIDDPSLERQGEEFATMNDPKALHVSLDTLPSDNPVDHSKPDGLTADVLHDTFGANFSASSEYPEPERMLLAPSGDHGIPDDLEHTSDKGTSQLDGRVERSRSLSSKRRYVVEDAPDLQNGSSAKVSEVPRMKRKIDHIPDDDDLLVSILVGKGASGFKLKSTPSLPASSFLKKSRLTIKTGVQKRKALQDDTMVLHADAIRQQLISTEDIRRIRKKAPCTRSEIWMIKKSFSEDETFGESTLSGMPEELASLYIQDYDPIEIPFSEPDSNFPHSDVSKSNFPGSAEIVSGTTYEGMNNSLVVSAKNDGMAQGSESRDHFVKQDCEVDLSACEHDVLGSERENNEPELLLEKSSLEQVVNHIRKDDFSVGIDDTIVSKEYCKELENKSCIVDEACLVSPQDSTGDRLHNLNSEAFSSYGNSLAEDGSDKQTESVTVIADASTCVSEFPTENSNSVGPSSITNDQCVVVTSQQHLGVPFDDQIASSSCPPELHSDMRIATSSLEFSIFQEPAGQKPLEAEDVLGLPTVGDSSGFCSVTGGNVTDFLIGDDEADLDEEGNYDVPNTDVQSLENSGWSVRTRGVARYLKLLFDDDSGFGRKAVEMDRLLAGKTRKEASRMFFETLVLKTKDYLQVQQQNSYDDISIRPTTKLLKSEF